MNTHKGKPAGDAKEENQQKSKPSEKLHTHTRLSTEKYIDEEGLDETVKPKHPNRNTRNILETSGHPPISSSNNARINALHCNSENPSIAPAPTSVLRILSPVLSVSLFICSLRPW